MTGGRCPIFIPNAAVFIRSYRSLLLRTERCLYPRRGRLSQISRRRSLQLLLLVLVLTLPRIGLQVAALQVRRVRQLADRRLLLVFAAALRALLQMVRVMRVVLATAHHVDFAGREGCHGGLLLFELLLLLLLIIIILGV